MNTGGSDSAPVLPLARIKRLMRSDEDVRMISSETPVLFSRACELFIAELTKAAYENARDNNEKVIDHEHIMNAIMTNDKFDFLRMVMPKEPEGKTAGAVKEEPHE